MIAATRNAGGTGDEHDALYYVDEDALAGASRRRARGLFHSVGDLGEGGTGRILPHGDGDENHIVANGVARTTQQDRFHRLKPGSALGNNRVAQNAQPAVDLDFSAVCLNGRAPRAMRMSSAPSRRRGSPEGRAGSMRAFIEAGGNRPEELMDAGSRTEHPGMTASLSGWLYRRPSAPRRQTPGEPDLGVVGSGLCRRPGADCSDARPAARSLDSSRHSRRMAYNS
jgi:hypothetical protein